MSESSPAVGVDVASLGTTRGVTAAVRRRAQSVLAAFALEHDDPAAWLADMLSALGLDGAS